MKLAIRRLVVAAAAAVATTGAPETRAQEFPNRPIRAIVGLPPGGPLDLTARLYSEYAQKTLGQPIVIENRPGAAGRIAAEAVAKAAPDGYTLLVAGASMTAYPALFKGLAYDVQKDLTPVAITVDNYAIVWINSAVPAKSIRELSAYAKTNTGKLNYGSFGKNHFMIFMEALKRSAAIPMTEVPFQGTPQLIAALLRNDIQVLAASAGTLASQHAAGAVRPLALVGPARNRGLPDVPTLAEAGYPEVVFPAWFGLFAPGATPRPVIERLYREVAAALKQPDVVSKIEAIGSEALGLGPDASRERFARELAFFTKTAREINLQPD